mmetsp:Transcript_10701/g.23604  ORF Transcript_10701/g.23604 Transcript_10701/m.23604 type:complete len:555 (+) Transcript_10701:76-1740(+)
MQAAGSTKDAARSGGSKTAAAEQLDERLSRLEGKNEEFMQEIDNQIRDFVDKARLQVQDELGLLTYRLGECKLHMDTVAAKVTVRQDALDKTLRKEMQDQVEVAKDHHLLVWQQVHKHCRDLDDRTKLLEKKVDSCENALEHLSGLDAESILEGNRRQQDVERQVRARFDVFEQRLQALSQEIDEQATNIIKVGEDRSALLGKFTMLTSSLEANGLVLDTDRLGSEEKRLLQPTSDDRSTGKPKAKAKTQPGNPVSLHSNDANNKSSSTSSSNNGGKSATNEKAATNASSSSGSSSTISSQTLGGRVMALERRLGEVLDTELSALSARLSSQCSFLESAIKDTSEDLAQQSSELWSWQRTCSSRLEQLEAYKAQRDSDITEALKAARRSDTQHKRVELMEQMLCRLQKMPILGNLASTTSVGGSNRCMFCRNSANSANSPTRETREKSPESASRPRGPAGWVGSSPCEKHQQQQQQLQHLPEALAAESPPPPGSKGTSTAGSRRPSCSTLVVSGPNGVVGGLAEDVVAAPSPARLPLRRPLTARARPTRTVGLH